MSWQLRDCLLMMQGTNLFYLIVTKKIQSSVDRVSVLAICCTSQYLIKYNMHSETLVWKMKVLSTYTKHTNLKKGHITFSFP